jgi:Ca2+-transporting ATPase
VAVVVVVHVLFLEFVIDPACAFVFEADREAADIMHRKPRRADVPLFTREMLTRSALLGLAALAFTCAVYAIALMRSSDDVARALAFFSIVVANLALIFVSRSQTASLTGILARPNSIYWWIAGVAFVAVCAAILVPSVSAIFQFAQPTWTAMGIVLSGGLLLMLVLGALSCTRQ